MSGKIIALVSVFSLMLAAPLAMSKTSGTTPAFGSRIAPEVYSELQASPDGTAYVIVVLEALAPFEAGQLERHQSAVGKIQERVLARLDPGEFSVVYHYRNFPILTGRVNATGLAELAKAPDVVAVGPDARGEAHLNQSVPFINADDVHNLGYTGQGTTVAVLDTGIDTDHPDLSDNNASGAWHFLNQGADQGPGAEDDNGHGTNVSGIITSKGQVASVGVAPDADILAIKVLASDGSGWASDWTAGVDYVVSVHNNYENLCAINMSLGTWDLFSPCPCDNTTGYNQAFQAAIQAARNVGITTFASSGNQGSCNTMSSPACLSGAVAVAAVYDQNLGREPNAGTYLDEFGGSFANCYDSTTGPDKITCFSNRSGCNELAGPGRLITGPWHDGGLGTYTGTSQAAPHCAGVVALLCERIAADCTSMSPADIVQLLKNTGDPTNDPCATSPNPVRVDALAAVTAVPPSPDCQPNGTADACDIANGTSLDCDGDGIPDECGSDYVDMGLFVGQLLIDASQQDAVLVCMFDQNDDGALDGHDIRGFVDRLLM